MRPGKSGENVYDIFVSMAFRSDWGSGSVGVWAWFGCAYFFDSILLRLVTLGLDSGF